MKIYQLKEKGKKVWKKYRGDISLGVIVLTSYGLGHKIGKKIGEKEIYAWLAKLAEVKPELLVNLAEAEVIRNGYSK